MLYLPESVYEARQRLIDDFQAGKIGDEQIHVRLLELCPDDDIALIGVGLVRLKEGDLKGAEDCFWHAIDFHPFQRTAYMHLAVMLGKQTGREELSAGLTELALRKLLLDQDAVERMGEQKFDLPSEIAEVLHDLDTPGQLGAVTELMRRTRKDEPAEVTERLRPYRLIHDLQESIEMDAQFVDELVGEGKAIVPLLVGVLRDWAQDFLPDDDEVPSRTRSRSWAKSAMRARSRTCSNSSSGAMSTWQARPDGRSIASASCIRSMRPMSSGRSPPLSTAPSALPSQNGCCSFALWIHPAGFSSA